MLRKIGFLSPAQFDLAVAGSRLSPKGKDAARRVLVGKESQAAIAKEIGVSREKVRQYCHAVYKRHIAIADCPEGWISTTICLPKSALAEVQALEKRLRIEHERRKSELLNQNQQPSAPSAPSAPPAPPAPPASPAPVSPGSQDS